MSYKIDYLWSLSLTVLFKFRTEKGRDPSPLSYLEDAEALRQMRLAVLASLGVGTDLIADDFARQGPPFFL